MLIGALAQYFFGFTIFVLSMFLILLVLVQRGRGGGLTGALGGPGGQSAFGTKAGDLFTRITVGVAAAWIILCASAVFVLRGKGLPETGVVNRPPTTMKSDAETTPGSSAPAASAPAAVSPATDSTPPPATAEVTEVPSPATPATPDAGPPSPAVPPNN